MAVIDLRGSSTPDLSGLAVGLQSLFGPSREEQLRQALQEALLSNPQLIASALGDEKARMQAGDFPAGIGDATKRVTPNTVSSFFGLSPTDLESVSKLLPETFEQQVSKERARRPGLAKQTVDVEESELGVVTEEQDARKVTAQFQTRTNQALLDNNIPERSAASSLLQLQAQDAKTEQEIQALEDYAGFLGTLSSAEQERASYALANPNFLADIQHRERLNLQRELAMLANTANPADQMVQLFQIKRGFLDEFRTLEEQLAQEDPDEGELQALLQRYNQLSNDYLQLFPNDPVTILDPIEALFGKGTKDVAFRTMMPQDIEDRVIVANILAGNWTTEDVMKESGLEDARKEKILQLVVEYESKQQTGLVERALDFGVRTIQGMTPTTVTGQPMSPEPFVPLPNQPNNQR